MVIFGLQSIRGGVVIENDSTGRVVVDKNFKLKKIDANSPTGRKVLLANREAGVVTTGQLPDRSNFFTHWCELPVFEDDE